MRGHAGVAGGTLMGEATIGYSGELLVSHLAGYGLLAALERACVGATLRHSSESLTFEPVIEFDGDDGLAARAIRESAIEAEEAVEADREPGRPLIWARHSLGGDSSLAAQVLRRREELLAEAERSGAVLTARLLSGLGAPAAWGSDQLKPSAGATALDGVMGNSTSDLVRGVLRPARTAAATVSAAQLKASWAGNGSDVPQDKTGWAPPGTRVALFDQWLAALGLSLFPVAHRQFQRSATPAFWNRKGGHYGVTLPIFSEPVTLPKLHAVLSLDALARVGDGTWNDDHAELLAAAALLRQLGARETVSFARLMSRGAGTSVAFTFKRGSRFELP